MPCLAFFEAPDMAFDFKPQHDYDRPTFLAQLEPMFDCVRKAGVPEQ